MILLIGIVIGLFIPFLIVGFWRRRPVWAFIVASIVFLISSIAPGIIKTFQAMMVYGAGDPELMAGGISESIVSAMLSLFVALPVLFVFQWLVRRHFKKRLAQEDIEATFS
jgi:O-antigen ligase